MRKLFILGLISIFTGVFANAQSLEELKSQKMGLETDLADKLGEVSTLESKINALTDQINLLSGWRTGFAGIIGLSLSESNKWAANPNPNSSSVGLSITGNAFANRTEEKWFWNNKLLANKAWQTVSIGEKDGGDLFDNGTIDILNVSSLYGYKLRPKLALSALGELNTSIENFLEPGTVDIGVGITWTPIPDLFVVVHPLNYRITFPADGNISSEGALGAKLRVDYARELKVLGKDISWSTTLLGFLPYSDTKLMVVDGDGMAQEAGLQEFTWLNTISFNLWKGVGVGGAFGIRKADFEVYDELQSFYTLGLSYTL